MAADGESDGGPGRARAGQQARKLASAMRAQRVNSRVFSCVCCLCVERTKVPRFQNCGHFVDFMFRIFTNIVAQGSG